MLRLTAYRCSLFFSGRCSVHMWVSNSFAAALRSRTITGAHQEQAVQVTTFPLGVTFVPIERLISEIAFTGTVPGLWFAQEAHE